MLHHTKVNDCVTEAGCNKQSGMTHFPEGWTRLARRHRWLASPSGLARERAREKKRKKRGARSILASVADGRCRSGGGRDTQARKGKKKFLAGHGRLGLGLGAGSYRYMSDWATHTFGVHMTLPRSIGPKPGPVKPLTRKQAVKSGALCPLPAFPAGPSPRGQQRQGARWELSSAVGASGRQRDGMADAFQVWLGGSTHLWGSRTPS